MSSINYIGISLTTHDKAIDGCAARPSVTLLIAVSVIYSMMFV